MTDFQIYELYLKPAAKRANASKSDSPGDGTDPFEKGLPPRDEFIRAMSSQGGSLEHWNRVYDQLQAEQEAKGKP